MPLYINLRCVPFWQQHEFWLIKKRMYELSDCSPINNRHSEYLAYLTLGPASLKRLSMWNLVQLFWAKSHLDLPWKENANSLAKLRAQKTPTDPATYVGFYFKALSFKALTLCNKNGCDRMQTCMLKHDYYILWNDNKECAVFRKE